jgi:hypothetical protein
VLSLDEEAKLCKHLKDLASVGYGYTRAEVVNLQNLCISRFSRVKTRIPVSIESPDLASDYAVSLGKRKDDQPFTLNWFYNFIKRWPELNVVRPSSLSEQRAKCASEESVTKYFNELERILRKYDLFDKPHLIYNIDEKGINTEYKPPSVVSGKDCKAQVIMSERGKTVTIIGAGNAAGMQIPPYFVFPGVRMLDGLLEGKSPGADGIMTPSGWSNSVVFKDYLQNHFMKFCQGRSDDTILILYDGHRSHISVDLVEWAKQQNIVLFVLPPHTSHILQPMDIGCFGPLQLKYAQECSKFARTHHRVVTRYDVCSLACKAYSFALSPLNLQASFNKAGIYPFKNSSSMVELLKSKIKPSELYIVDDEVTASGDHKKSETAENNFFDKKGGDVHIKIMKKKRKSINSIVGGKALEGETVEKMKKYIDESNSKISSNDPKKKKTKTPKNKKNSATSFNLQINDKQKPGPSKQNIELSEKSDLSDSENESEIPDEDKCCQCHQYYVDKHSHGAIEFTHWAQCDNATCSHWVHLKYCSPVRVVRKNTVFYCNCCL